MIQEPEPILKIEGLRKIYEDGTVGVDGLDVQLGRGESFVMLGANGAGKTSTIMMMFDFIRPTAGTIKVAGHDVQKEPLEAKKHLAYVSEDVALYRSLTARQNIQLFARLGGRLDVDDNTMASALRRVGLAETALRRRVRGFSKGMRQRLGLAIAILKRAPLIVLDEPTSGLDPKGAADLVSLLKDLQGEGHAIFMSSHDIFRAKQVADHVGIMRRGRLVGLFTRGKLETIDLEDIYLGLMEDEVAGATSVAAES